MQVHPAAWDSPGTWLYRRGLGDLLARILGIAVLAPLVLGTVSELAGAAGVGLPPRARAFLDYVFCVGWSCAPLLTLASLCACWLSWQHAGIVTVDNRELCVPRGRSFFRIPRDRILGGLVISGHALAFAQIQMCGGDVLVIAFISEEHARSFIDTLGLGPHRRRVVVKLGTSAQQVLAWVSSVFVGFCAGLGAIILVRLTYLPSQAWENALMVAVATSVTGLGGWLARPPVVTVGSDGVTISRPWKARFIPRSEIIRAHVAGTVLELVRLDGTSASVAGSGLLRPFAGRPGAQKRPTGVEILGALVGRIKETVRQGSGTAPDAAILELLDSTVMPDSEHVRALKALSKASTYRTPGHSPKHIVDILTDPHAPAARRIAASVSLSACRSPGGRATILAARDMCANEGTREALQSAADGDFGKAMLRRRRSG